MDKNDLSTTKYALILIYGFLNLKLSLNIKKTLKTCLINAQSEVFCSFCQLARVTYNVSHATSTPFGHAPGLVMSTQHVFIGRDPTIL